MPITRTPCRKVTAYQAGEFVDDFDCREDIDDFIDQAAQSYSVTAHRAICALGDFDEYRQTEPTLFFIVTADRTAAHLTMNNKIATTSAQPIITNGLTVVWDPETPYHLAAADFAISLETLQEAVFEFVDTGHQPTNITWRTTR